MTTQTEAPPQGLAWLRGSFEQVRGELAGLQRQVTSLRMRTAALESELELSAKREEELRNQLREAEEQLDSGYSEVRANLRADYLSDLVQLASRCNALATFVALLASRGSASAGPDALDRLGASPDVVATVRAMAYGQSSVTPAPRLEGYGGVRYTPEPPAAQQYASAPHEPNHVQFRQPWSNAAEREAWEHQADVDNKPRTSSVQEIVTGVPAPPNRPR